MKNKKHTTPPPSAGALSQEDQIELDRLHAESLDLSKLLDEVSGSFGVFHAAVDELTRLRKELAEARAEVLRLQAAQKKPGERS